jgi:hypothetical protein
MRADSCYTILPTSAILSPPPLSSLPLQDPSLPEDATVLEAVLRSDSTVARAVRRYQTALANSSGEKITKVGGRG